MFPNFILVGVDKSATTWIYKCLIEHPDIYFPPYRSEVHFFDRNYEKGISFYKKFYSKYNNEKAVGDLTPTYMHNEKIAELIKYHLPNAKIIFSLRHPVNRIYSEYLHLYRNTNMNISFRKMTENKEFLRKSLYYEKVKKYFDLFPRNNILILIFETIRNNPQASLKKIYRFLEVRNEFIPKNLKSKKNINVQPNNIKIYRLIMLALRKLRHKHNPKIDYFIEIVKKSGLKSLISKKNNKIHLKKEEKEKLFNFYRKDIEKLSELIEIDLMHYWTV